MLFFFLSLSLFQVSPRTRFVNNDDVPCSTRARKKIALAAPVAVGGENMICKRCEKQAVLVNACVGLEGLPFLWTRGVEQVFCPSNHQLGRVQQVVVCHIW